MFIRKIAFFAVLANLGLVSLELNAQESDPNIKLVFNMDLKTTDVDGSSVTTAEKVLLDVANKRQIPLSCSIYFTTRQGEYCKEVGDICNQKSKAFEALRVAIPSNSPIHLEFAADDGKVFFSEAVSDVSAKCEPVSFIDWCEESKLTQSTLQINAGARTTLNFLFTRLRTQECQKINNLTKLSLSSQNLADLRPVFGMPRLENLSANYNDQLDLSGISRAKRLKILSLSGNHLNSEAIAELGQLTNLEELDLSFNEIEDIEVLRNLSSLLTLNLGVNRLKALPPALKWTKLQELDLFGNQGLVDLQPLLPLFQDGSLGWVDARCTRATVPAEFAASVALGAEDCQEGVIP